MAFPAKRYAPSGPARVSSARRESPPDELSFNIAAGVRAVIANSSRGAVYPAVASWITLFTLIQQVDLRLAVSAPGPAKMKKFRKLVADLAAEGVRLLTAIPPDDRDFEAGTGVSYDAFAACVRKLDHDLAADALKLTDRKAAAILKKALGR